MIEINGINYEFNQGETILEVARRNKIKIPTLCYMKDVLEESSCRICMVENLQNGRLMTACSTRAEDGMKIATDSDAVIKSRKHTLEMLLSNHHKDCINCQKNGNCDLQVLFNKYGINETSNRFTKKKYEIDNSSPCIVRDINKCILCGRCQNVCKNVQSVSALTKQQRGFDTFMGCAFDMPISESTCVGCGQCVLACPTGALVEKSELNEVIRLLNDENNYVTCQIAPSVRVSLAEIFDEDIGTFDEGRMVSALKQIGFKKVFDINLGADFTVEEESKELLERIKNNKRLPQFSSCCPAWFKFVERFYPQYLDHISTCKSPTEMLGAIVKNYYSHKNNIDKDKIKVVGIMPCTAKKGEKQRAKDVDYVITTRELAKLIEYKGIDYLSLEGGKFDSPLSSYSGGGLIFGVTGGVTEAVLRHVCAKLDKDTSKIEFNEVRNSGGRKEVEVVAGDTKINLCIVNGLANARRVLDDIIAGKVSYDFVEVMACPGGCINGGGQAYVDRSKYTTADIIAKRSKSLYEKDRQMQTRISADNKTMNEIYDEFFIPSPNKAKELLHYRHD